MWPFWCFENVESLIRGWRWSIGFWSSRGTDNKQTPESEEKEYENIRYETCVKRIFWKTELVGQGRLPETAINKICR